MENGDGLFAGGEMFHLGADLVALHPEALLKLVALVDGQGKELGRFDVQDALGGVSGHSQLTNRL